MPHIRIDNTDHYYEDIGGHAPGAEVIIANHGLNECTLYWSLPGVARRLGERYRLISYDMRAHGRTRVHGERKGFDAVTMAHDIDALADALGIGRFHLLSHATGGMVAARYAMQRHTRLRSLLLTDTGSATAPGFHAEPERWEAVRAQRRAAQPQPPPAALVDPAVRAAGLRKGPKPFLHWVNHQPDAEAKWQQLEQIFVQTPDLPLFRARFYDDPDPMLDALQQITCPTLVLLGSGDDMFIEPSQLMAQHIPNNKHVVIDNVGHMTAVEAPERTAQEILGFLERLPR